MKTIGLIGGMSWESTIPYYSIINEKVRDALGGLHSAKILMYSVEFHDIEKLQSTNQWEEAGEILADISSKLEGAGADMILICANTMHKVCEAVEAKVSIPVVHIADATGDRLEEAGIHKVGLLGTRYTMQEDFYKSRLLKRGFEVLIPKDEDIPLVNSVIYDELCVGEVKDSSRKEFVRIIDELKEMGAEAVILGCTEIDMLISQDDSSLPLFDTTVIHAEKAAEIALDDSDNA